METVSLDLWAVHLEPVLPDLGVWLSHLDQRAAQASQRGAHMLVLPELACAQWLTFAPADLPAKQSLGWLADVGLTALDAISTLAGKYNLSIMAGTIPFRAAAKDGTAGSLNRAWLLTPDGARFHQDKLSLTPAEATGAGGVVIPGRSINVIKWHGLRLAIVICLDAEFTSLWSRLGNLDLDLVIIPAKTDMLTGYSRVFTCARARAIELQTAVCAVGAVGVPGGHPATDTGVGGASAFVPCDVSISLDGVFASLPPQTAAVTTDTLLPVVSLPVGLCRRLRNGHAEAEVSPALWDASHLTINDPGTES